MFTPGDAADAMVQESPEGERKRQRKALTGTAAFPKREGRPEQCGLVGRLTSELEEKEDGRGMMKGTRTCVPLRRWFLARSWVCKSNTLWTFQLIEWLIAHFKDAVWLIPLRGRERRYFVGRLFNKYFVYLCTAQGSSGRLSLGQL